jgi:RNA polymerase sigma-54 factor
MALSPKLSQRQTTALVMTPQLQQAIKLLQMSNQELTVYVDQELVQNPLLEIDDGGKEDDGPEVGANGKDDTDRGGDGTGDDADATGTKELSGTQEKVTDLDQAPLETDFEDAWTGEHQTDGSGSEAEAFAAWNERGGGFNDSEYNIEQFLATETSLRDHLVAQLNVDIADAVDRMIGLHLIDMIDEAGYLAGEIGDIAELLNCEPGRVEATLGKLQQFEPPGLFARSLGECLALQLRELNRLDPAMQCLLDHLDLLAKRDFAALRKICRVDAEDLAEMIEEIKALDPKPGLAFDHDVAQSVTPEVVVRPDPAGGWHVELRTETLPKVLVNRRYFAKIKGQARSKEDKVFITDRLQTANWLVKSLDQRANTILKVASEIVRRQDGFLRHGVQYLRPLILRDIADAIDMHESTVSRVTANKYISTPRGIYEMKYFFTSAIANSEGGMAHSAEAVRARIKGLVDKEEIGAVLSDDKIVDILRNNGIDIARRTVAKYREALRIPSSVQRRREKMVVL